jgi:hypothetical protein
LPAWPATSQPEECGRPDGKEQRVSLKTLQVLARHSRVETTLKHYARVQMADVRSALDVLPPLPETGGQEALRATGTDGQRLARCLALSQRFQASVVDSGTLAADGVQEGKNPRIPFSQQSWGFR